MNTTNAMLENQFQFKSLNLQKIRSFIIDFDSIIIDLKLLDYRSWVPFFTRYSAGLDILTYLKYTENDSSRNILINFLRSMVSGAYLDINEILNSQAKSLDIRLNTVVPKKDTVSFISSAFKKNYKLGVISSELHYKTAARLKNMGLLKYFKSVKGRDDVNVEKNKIKNIFCEINRDMGIKADEVIAITSSPLYIKAAREINIKTVAIPNQISKYQDLSEADLIWPNLEGGDPKIFVDKLFSNKIPGG